MTRKELPARAANILRAVASTATCTPATVESLRSALAVGDVSLQQQNKSGIHNTQPRKQARQTQAVKTGAARARKQPAVAVLEIPGEGQDAVQAQERLALAIEVANVTLKSLTDAIKRPFVQPKRTPLARSSSNASLSQGLNSRCQTPLQPLCGNRVTVSPKKPSHLRRSSSTVSAKDTLDGIRAQAECARIAYATLRSMQSSKDFLAQPFLQLEHGMSALITKLTALGFDDLAVKELRILRRRLENSGEPSSRKKAYMSTSPDSEGDKPNPQGETLSSMLKYRNIDVKGPLLTLITASQLHVLKILAVRRDPSVIKSCIQHLGLDVAYSPAILIQRQISDEPETHARVARYLESLAHHLLALCPLTSSTEKRGISDSRSLLPEVAFQIQLLALQVRHTWWKVAGHQSDISHEMIRPFSRYLATFHHKSKLAKQEKYDMANQAFQVVSMCVQDVAGYHEEMFLDVYQSLADLAQDASKHSEAVRWIGKSRRSATKCGASPIQLCTMACHSATLQLRAADSCSDEALKSLQEAASTLVGDLQGESGELDELLIAVASLRKSSFSVVQVSQKGSPTGLSVFAEECRNAVLLCLKFMIRYLGSGPGLNENEKTLARRTQRKKTAEQVAIPAVESVVAMARLAISAPPNVWEKLEAGLRDCVVLVTRLEDSDKETTALVRTTSKHCWSPHVSISHAYWCRFLRLKQGTTESKQLRDCLRTSIDLLKHRSISEKTEGSLATKFERYGQICKNLREHGKAADAYQEALAIQIECGLLTTAAEAALSRSLPLVFEDRGELALLSRVLLAYPGVALKATGSEEYRNPFYDPEGLCVSERGILLEKQLNAVASLLLDRDPSAAVCNALSELAERLLSIYTRKTFPIRRLRVVVRLLGLLLARPEVLDSGLQGQLLQESHSEPTGDHSDTDLLQFLPHLAASHTLLIALYGKEPSIEELETAITFWARLVQEFPGWPTLQAHIYDVADWLTQLELLAGYLEMQSLDLLRVPVLHILITLNEAATTMQCSVLIVNISALGTQYSRLGYSGRAGLILHKAQRYLGLPDVSATAVLRWHLSYAEHALVTGNLSHCKQNLAKAAELYDGSVKLSPGMIGARVLSEQSQLIADACYVRSLLAQAEKQTATAIFYARLCIKSCNQAWTILDRSHGRMSRTVRKASPECVNDPLLNSMSELSISEDQAGQNTATPYSNLHLTAFWSLIPRLCWGHIRLSSLFAHNGLVPEVLYYLGQAKKVVQVVHASVLIGQCLAITGQISICQGEVAAGASVLQQAEMILFDLPHDQRYAMVQSLLAVYSTRRGESQAGEAAFATAEKTLQQLTTTKFLDSLAHKIPNSENLEAQMQLLTLEKNNAARQPKIRQGRSTMKKSTSTSSTQQKPSMLAFEEIPAIEAAALNRRKGELLRQRISALMYEGRVDRAAQLLGTATAFPCDAENVVLQALLASRIRLCQGLDQLISDPVFCVLHESTISHPSNRSSCDSRGRQSVSQELKTKTNVTASTTRRSKGLRKTLRPRSPSMPKAEADYLCLAHSSLRDALRLARKVSSTTTLHEITDVLARTLLILSATSSASGNAVSAYLLAYILEMGRVLAMKMNSAVIHVEQELSQSREAYQWPSEQTFEDPKSFIPMANYELATFQADYIDILPASWVAISITLSESREEIFICKMRACQTPFVLRLPLDRHSSELECDEEKFGFDQGKAELQDIISLANRSTHGAEELSHKGAKTEWWEARNTLDARLKDLLNNIQTIWLGGFKGILSQEHQDPDLLSRFQQSLQNILDKHLPSRQKSGKGHQSSRVTLDSRVLELFVGLGPPSECNDVDEPLMDLLYFVVDILQFSGERNAYDEVDFDSITIETIDALRQYHQAIQDKNHSGPKQHTILILDKNLHCFPWESLPCLDGHAVSRLPSLGCLRDRILQQRKQREQCHTPPVVENNYQVSREGGSWVLNPAGDLTATQDRFEEPLQGLPGWESIIRREPTEAEMKSCLEDHDLFLYFGHGSGGQYIRSRTIKRLENCAVALLMGCSSGALTEAGEFEPYGTPMSYIQAGCPALLATLWDVTDKDIDRFSYRVLEKWGLFERPQPQTSPVKKSAKQKGKSRARAFEATTNTEKDRMSLEQAVAESRDSCNLRFLNGAAPVVYGVPVYLA